MAGLPSICLPGIPQHIIQRGTNRQVCFASEEDFSATCPPHYLGTKYTGGNHYLPESAVVVCFWKYSAIILCLYIGRQVGPTRRLEIMRILGFINKRQCQVQGTC